MASQIASKGHSAKQCSNKPRSPSLIVNEGVLSLWAGHFDTNPRLVCFTPSNRFSNSSRVTGDVPQLCCRIRIAGDQTTRTQSCGHSGKMECDVLASTLGACGAILLGPTPI